MTPHARNSLAVAVCFGVLGLVCTAWASSIDDLKVLLGLTASQQGWLLLSGPAGSLASFSFASPLLVRVGARRCARAVGWLYLVAALAVAACFRFRAPVPFWCLSLAFLGGMGNLVNISINTMGGTVERRLGRSRMNAFHGLFSLMCLVGGLLTLGCSVAGVSVAARFLGVLAVAAVAFALSVRFLPEDEAASAPAAHVGRRPDRALLLLGGAALVVMGCEGAVADWIGVFFRESLSVDERHVKWGFCALTGMMAFGRFSTGRLVDRFGSVRVFRTDALLVFAGLALALPAPCLMPPGAPLLALATAGFAVAGFGLSGLVPILYSKASRSTAMPPASAITFIGSAGFAGYFAGPPLIGHLAEWTSLSVALGVFALLMLFCVGLDIERDGRDR